MPVYPGVPLTWNGKEASHFFSIVEEVVEGESDLETEMPFSPVHYGNETIKIMEALAEHDFGSIWLVEVHCAPGKSIQCRDPLPPPPNR